MQVEFMNLSRQYLVIQEEVSKAISKVFSKSEYILGSELRAFEKEFADYNGAKHCIGVASGTDALKLSLLSLGIGKGDEVIVPANSYIATALAVSETGATPIFCDCEKVSLNVDPESVKKNLSPRTKAIMPVHLYGQPCDMDPLIDLAKENDLRIVEDACQAHGAEFKSRKCGAIGTLGCFSFYPTKNLGCYGDGGAILTGDEALADRIRMLRNYGQSKKYYHDIKGFNSRLDELQAAILRVKLRRLDEFNEKRRANAKLYHELLQESSITLPPLKKGAVYHLYVVRSKKRDQLRDYLEKQGIQTAIHYPVPIHKQNAYNSAPNYNLPICETASSEILSIPFFPEIFEKEINHVCENIRRFS